MSLFEKVKKYFVSKENNEQTANAPEGVCPNCWGRQEWDGEFYKKIKANNITPNHSTYDSFVHKVVEKLDKITLKKDTFECETCKTA